MTAPVQLIRIHPTGERVAFHGLRNTRTGELRFATEEEMRWIRAEWAKYGDPRVREEVP